jgi:hypothetical protein
LLLLVSGRRLFFTPLERSLARLLPKDISKLRPQPITLLWPSRHRSPIVPANRLDKAIRVLALAWTAAAIILGAALTSYHQPFQSPAIGDSKILALASPPTKHQWRAIHILSGGCACSQRVMSHLLARRPIPNIDEQILLIDLENTGPETYLPGSSNLIAQLKQSGFSISHLSAASIPQDANLHGVPLLVLISPANKIAYQGGYGPNSDQDTYLLTAVTQNTPTKPLPILGCAIGARLRRTLDPLHLKY